MRIPVGLKAIVNFSHVSNTDDALPVGPGELIGNTAVISRDSAWRSQVTLQAAARNATLESLSSQALPSRGAPKAELAASMQLSAFCKLVLGGSAERKL